MQTQREQLAHQYNSKQWTEHTNHVRNNQVFILFCYHNCHFDSSSGILIDGILYKPIQVPIDSHVLLQI